MSAPPAKMKATMPPVNGERSRSPVCGSRRKPPAGTVPASRKAVKSTPAAVAYHRPRFSSAVSGARRPSASSAPPSPP